MMGQASVNLTTTRKRRQLAALPLLLLPLWLSAAEPVVEASVPPSPAASGAAASRPDLYAAAEVQAFLQQAEALRLAERREWRTLLHWGWRGSQVDDPKFFLSPRGKTDAAAELQADLAAFFAPPPPAPQLSAADRFPARLEWLAAVLKIDRRRLPMPECAEVEAALRSLEPRGVVLVFPSAYMNTPASMFGHTLITVRGRRHSERMNQAVNYAALIPPGSNGVVFAFKGVFGFYPGYYSLLPYYQKISEYSDMEQRDLWEYELNLDPEETRRLLLHVWEVRNISSDYYFFDENCSYNLLYLLDAARPGLDLVPKFNGLRFWVIPLDTVRALKQAGLVTKVNCRPSLATQVRYHATLLEPAEAKLAEQVGQGEVTPQAVVARPGLKPERAAQILDLGAEYLQSLRGRHKIAQEAYADRFFGILAERSQLPTAEDETVSAPAATLSPDQSHGSGRLMAGLGWNGGRGFADLGYRPAYHDLMDSDAGFSPGTEVEFFNLAGRWYEHEDAPELQRLDAIRIRSYAVRDQFYDPWSWDAGTGVVRERVGSDARGVYTFYGDVGGGMTWQLGRETLVYAIGLGDLRLGGLQGDYAFGIGPKAGLLLPITPRWKLHLYGQYLEVPLGDTAHNWSYGLQQRWTLTQDTAISLEIGRKETWGCAQTEISLKFLWYF